MFYRLLYFFTYYLLALIMAGVIITPAYYALGRNEWSYISGITDINNQLQSSEK
jgi:hypothetical protein